MAQRQGRQGRGLGARLGAAGSRRGALVLAGIVVVLALGGMALLARSSGNVVVRRQENTPAATDAVVRPTTEATQEAAPDPVVVHVDGAVTEPGVYTLELDAPRVNDAILAAGGLAADADTTSLNLADVLADGQKVHVPVEGEATDSTDTATASAAAGAPVSSGPVNINLAGVDELDALPGIGPSTAQAIVEDRQANGPFASAEDLMRVSGIGEKKFAKLVGRICV